MGNGFAVLLLAVLLVGCAPQHAIKRPPAPVITVPVTPVIGPIVKPSPESAPTPGAEVERVIGLLPKPKYGFVDFGCGDGRWLIAAAERWGCRVTGIEIDPARAEATRERVRAAGLEKLITIITGNAIDTEVTADVGVAYLYPQLLERMRPRLEKLTAFASYIHQPPGLMVVKNGDSWFYTQPPMTVVRQKSAAVWDGQTYLGPVCNNPQCQMCNSIRQQLTPQLKMGYYVRRCQNGYCWMEWVSQ